LVSTGNLNIQVPVRRSEGDFARLGETFNKMTQELRMQHEDIVRARDLIDQRRRFTEAVLAGASAGVIGVNASGRINLILDFGNVRFLSSAVLGLLIRINKRIYECEGQLRLCSISPKIYEIFKITRLTKTFDIYESIEDAIEDLSQTE
jgi:anti-anti-sigma factor